MAYSLDDGRVARSPELPESIFLWGAPRSGKSGFAGSLYGLGLSDRPAARWTAHPRDALDEHTHEELKRAYRDLQQLGYRKTDVRTPAPLRLIVRKRTKDRELDAIALSLVDPAGEWVTDAGHRASFDGVDVHRRAAQSNGLIWLVEPVDTPVARSRTQAELLPQLIALLEASGGKQIGIPVAICLSMVDRLSSIERERALADARTVLGELLGESVTRWFEALCPEHRYFAISSAGLSTGAVDPLNVSEVLDWVVERGRAAAKARPRTDVAIVRTPGLAVRTGVLALAGLAGFGTYSFLHRPPTAPTTSAGEVRAPLDTITVRTRSLDTSTKREPAPEVRPQGAAHVDDSAGAREAFRRLARASGAELTRWADTARARASRVLESGPAGSRMLAPMHYIRARACGVPMMHCDRHQVIEDYTWVRVHGTLAQREEARRALDTLVVRRRHASR
ncbi:MAG TPA: hypothetical protein VGP95_12845 [Gemmatimonadaceae bacterium]|nr:hypothetical protein [Gemmatimonadaceae bacterium]